MEAKKGHRIAPFAESSDKDSKPFVAPETTADRELPPQESPADGQGGDDSYCCKSLARHIALIRAPEAAPLSPDSLAPAPRHDMATSSA